MGGPFRALVPSYFIESLGGARETGSRSSSFCRRLIWRAGRSRLSKSSYEARNRSPIPFRMSRLRALSPLAFRRPLVTASHMHASAAHFTPMSFSSLIRNSRTRLPVEW